MKSRASACILFAIIVSILQPAVVHAADYELYFLGGQSNMEGLGYVKELPPDLQKPMEGVMIFHGNSAPDAAPEDGCGIWAKLQPGHGFGFRSDGKRNAYCDRFGPEVSFAARLREIKPQAKIAIIKYARAGSSIDAASAGEFGCWDPDFDGGSGAARGINQYDHFLATLRNAFAMRDIDGDGEEDRLIPTGIIWMQGEGDASYTEESARRYGPKLARLMDLIRAAMLRDDLPVVIGRISDSGKKTGEPIWKFGDIVRKAQEQYAEADAAAAIVTTTDGYSYSDPYHYDTAGYLDLGRRFADAVVSLRKGRVSKVVSEQRLPAEMRSAPSF